MNRKTISFLFIASLFLVLVSGCKKDNLTPVCDGSTPTYDGAVKTIINTNCNSNNCHDAGSNRGDFTTYALMSDVLTNGKFESEVLEKQSMPRGGTLSQEEINVLQCWLENSFAEN